MGLLTGKALQYAKSLVALVSLVLSALNTIYLDNQIISIGLVVAGAVAVWLTENRETVQTATTKLQKAVEREQPKDDNPEEAPDPDPLAPIF